MDGSKTVTIFDGSNYPNSKWKDHCLWALRITSLVDIDTSSRKCLNFVTPGTPFKQPSGKQDDDKWAVRISPKSLKQRDGYNCGPIVCLHAWEVLSCGTFSAENLEYKRYRETVVNKYSSLLCKFSSSLLIRNTPDFIDLACDDNVKAPSMLKLNCTDDVNEVEENKEARIILSHLTARVKYASVMWNRNSSLLIVAIKKSTNTALFIGQVLGSLVPGVVPLYQKK